MRSGPHIDIGVDKRILAALAARGERAVEMKELMELVAAKKQSFWSALSRLSERGQIFRWDTEDFLEYFVLTEHRDGAFYEVTVQLQTSIFSPPVTATVRRSPPFITLLDDDVSKRTRYAKTVV